MKLVRPADTASMARLVAGLRDVDLTYAAVGATLRGDQPIGFRHDHYQTRLGPGADTFERAVRGLQAWQAHRLPGIGVFPAHSVIAAQEIVIVTCGTRLLALAAPCRIIDVVDEPNRWGFAYGTLPGHPEQGEEAFVVTRAEDGDVRFEVTVFSRPGDVIVGLSGPVGRWLQRRGSNGYLRALRRSVERGAQ
jgi:uncharacterized protein (UPF0548 family)